MRSNKRVALSVAALAITGLVAGCAGGSSTVGTAQAEEETFTLTYATSYGAQTDGEVVITWFLDEIEERTDGRVQFERYYDASLVPSADMPVALRDGMVDATNFVANGMQHLFPLWNAAYVPLPGSNNNALAQAQYELAAEGPLADELERNNVHFAAIMTVQTMGILGRTPIESVDDIRGVQVRGAGLGSVMMTELGANPVTIPIEETFDALQRGTIEAFNGANISYQVLSGIGEAAPYFSDYRLGAVTAKALVLNKDTWDSLPADIQEIITNLGENDWPQYEADTLRDVTLDACRQLIEAGGGAFAWDDAARDEALEMIGDSLAETWITQVADAGVPEQEARDFLDTLQTRALELAEGETVDDGTLECVEMTASARG